MPGLPLHYLFVILHHHQGQLILPEVQSGDLRPVEGEKDTQTRSDTKLQCRKLITSFLQLNALHKVPQNQDVCSLKPVILPEKQADLGFPLKHEQIGRAHV